ncbi:MAG TPA: ParB/RepB/Spo0J family partition protein [Acidocella sp.]|jgi:ParB family chromosome partitioning protein|uniref:ParB/RepB/Spo0J family partition protein n=1 Tax=Acidocella sp. TaxID=50710 RepID=UPI002BEAF943|nr:ParB/RepB/Spo0J family partition protein [Acidocella sp.]HVE20627.1 ParB/RepB/Spo0J family partition protein [Acidocella sp.]
MAAVPKLTEEVIQAICARKRADPAITQDMLAAEFNLNRTSIKKALVMLNVPAVAAANDTGISLVDYDLIDRSSLNPRKTFDQTELEELAESIAVNGLLQNLVVRAGPEGRYILVAGERRYRAIGLLIDQARWGQPLPCRVIEADDGTHLALALLENLQRQDVAPLEEADAFVQLQRIDPKTWTAQAIAMKIGRTPRYVYQRLALANKLAPAAREALTSGKITIEAARLLTTAPADIQVDILDRATDDYDESGKISVEDITYELRGTLIDVEDALFDVEASALELVEIEGSRYFADRKAAIALQMEAVQAKAKALKKKWAFVTVLEPGERFNSWEYLTGQTKANGAGAFIVINKSSYDVTIHEGLLTKPKEDPKRFDTSDYKAKQKAAQLERAERANAEIARFHALTPKLPTDYPPNEERQEGQKFCFDGCKFRQLLNYSAPAEFHVCTNPNSPRAAMLTHEEQGGNGCFEVS